MKIRLRQTTILTIAILVSQILASTPVSAQTAIRRSEATALGELAQEDCQVRWSRTASVGEPIKIQRIINCPVDQAGITKKLVEVLYDGQVLYTTLGELGLPLDGLPDIENIPPEKFSETIGKEIAAAMQRRESERVRKVSDLKKRLGSAGLAILTFQPYDISEYTDGTGLNIELANLSNKTIKYITFRYVGLNAVNDPVKDMRGAAVRGFKGVGPIEPNERVIYDREYAWMTDIVETVRIVRIEIEYMDKTKRNLERFDQLRISAEEAELLGL